LARDLRAGDEVLLRQGEVMSLESVRVDEVVERVYNFHVAELQNYAVGECGVLVHNTNDPPRARHHTDLEGMRGIQREGAINPGRGEPPGVHVETEPFGPTTPGRGGPKAETGAAKEGAYVEIDLPGNAIPDAPPKGPRNTAVIPTADPLPIVGLNPRFVPVRRWWNLWYFWR
jgi:hypothetical protein